MHGGYVSLCGDSNSYRKQLAQLQQEKLQACEKLLTEDQLADLKKRRAEAAAKAKKRRKGKKKVAN